MINFDTNLPIYIQLVDILKMDIISGKIKPGEKLESVRSLADIYSINPNTVQRALSDLETMGLITSKRTLGKFVTTNENLIEKLKDKAIESEIVELLKKLYAMGYTKEEILSSVKRLIDEN